MRYEIRYMVDGCGKKIPSTRTIVAIDGNGSVVKETMTQENLSDFIKRFEKNLTPPQGE